MIADTPIGEEIKLTYRRGTTSAAAPLTHTIPVKTEPPRKRSSPRNRPTKPGASPSATSPAPISATLRLPLLKGVLVTGVTSSLPRRAVAKIMSDDIILSIDGKPVTNVGKELEDRRSPPGSQNPKRVAEIVVRRDRNENTLVISIRRE